MTAAEAAAFVRLNQGPIGRNRWWLDGQGNIGLEGQGVMGNVAAMMRGAWVGAETAIGAFSVRANWPGRR